MPGSAEVSIQTAELAVFARKRACLDAAAKAGLPGRFGSFDLGGLRASMATAEPYGFLNAVEGVTDQSVGALPAMLERFPDSCRPAIIATSPSPELTEWLLGEGYEPAPARPLACWRPGIDLSGAPTSADQWRIREISTTEEPVFLDLLEIGYDASGEVRALIRAEHALPMVRGFMAFRDDRPVAAAAVSLHATGAVLGGAATVPEARGAGAQRALLVHRMRLVESLGVPMAAATATPGTPSLRNLARVGFTIVERTAWSFNRRVDSRA